MNKYNFSYLNDKDFESLSADIIGAQNKVRVERFKPGKDKGVDGRFFCPAGDYEVVIQCKHWLKSGFLSLYTHLKNSELSKIERLNPKQYILLTTVELSRENKSTLFNLLSPWIKSPKDIYGQEDLSDALATFQDIERKHFKLWMSSTSILQTILNNAVHGRSDYELKKMADQSKVFVETKHFGLARDRLESSHTLIVTGAAGAGKTTLAGQLCLHLAADGYSFYAIDSIREAEDVYRPELKQVFYFDDFLGQNLLEVFGNKEDSKIVKFIERVSSDPTKRFLLTTRTSILNRGKQISDQFDLYKTDKKEFEVEVSEYELIDKARILYNHIWHSRLDEDFISQIYFSRRYRAICQHKNFNPRLISFITDHEKVSDINLNEYWTYISNVLNKPDEIWRHVFDSQLDEPSQILSMLIAMNRGQLSEHDLKYSYEMYCKRTKCTPAEKVANEFYRACKIISGSVSHRIISLRSSTAYYDVFSPSFTDFSLARSAKNHQQTLQILSSLLTAKSLSHLDALKYAKALSDEQYIHVLRAIVHDLHNGIRECTDHQVLAELVWRLVITLKPDDADTILGLSFFKDLDPQILGVECPSTACDIIDLGGRHLAPLISDDFREKIAIGGLDSIDSDEDYEKLYKLIEQLPYSTRDPIVEKLQTNLVSIWSDNLGEYVNDAKIARDYLSEDDYHDVIREIRDFISESLSNIGFVDDSIVDAIVDGYDAHDHIVRNQERSSRYYYAEQSVPATKRVYSGNDEFSEIDNLFER